VPTLDSRRPGHLGTPSRTSRRRWFRGRLPASSKSARAAEPEPRAARSQQYILFSDSVLRERLCGRCQPGSTGAGPAVQLPRASPTASKCAPTRAAPDPYGNHSQRRLSRKSRGRLHLSMWHNAPRLLLRTASVTRGPASHHHRPPADTGHRSAARGLRPPAPAVSRPPSAVSVPPTTHHLSPITYPYHPSPITHHSSLITHHSSLITHPLSPTPYHLTAALAHVKPDPNAVSTRRSPRWSIPRVTTSCSAIGIEAAVVLPYRSMLL